MLREYLDQSGYSALAKLLFFGVTHPGLTFSYLGKDWRIFVGRDLLDYTSRICSQRPVSLEEIPSLLKSKAFFYYPHALYLLTKVLKPKQIVETGVGPGISSSYFLKALSENEKGELFSIDSSNEVYQSDGGRLVEGRIHFPHGERSGWVIPESLKTRWKLRIGRTQETLGATLEEASRIDFFFHDSDHTYANMIWEYETAWPHIRDGGILGSHEISLNGAFPEFCKRVGRSPFLVCYGAGFIIK